MKILGIDTSTSDFVLLLQIEGTIREHKVNLGRQMAEKSLSVLAEFLASSGLSMGDVDGIVCFSGPGSFTGLRIGHTLANTLAYTQNIPVVGAMGPNWFASGSSRIKAGENQRIIVPEYGGEANITVPKK